MESIWRTARESIKESMDKGAFHRWIEPLNFIECKGDTVHLGCPSAFFKEWIERHHRDIIMEALKSASGRYMEIRLRVVPPSNGKCRPEAGRQLDFSHLSHSPLWRTGLNRIFTFDRFVVGPCNEFAYSAALEVARSKRTRYNPLCFFADVGLGKSHLSSAIGNHIIEHDKDEKVYYISAEGFVNELVRALRTHQLEAFKDKFRRQCDVLLIDGVHFLSGKKRTQAELSHTLDELYYMNKRVILTCNIPPMEIPEMEESLKSRLGCGLVVDIKPPDLETRRRILRDKARREGVELKDDVVDYISRHVKGNVRNLESILIHFIAKASLMRRPMDLTLAQEVIHDLIHDLEPPPKPTIQKIQECVCRYFHLDLETLISRSRKRAIYYPRQIAMYLCRQHTGASLSTIGKAFNRDHASVIHSIAVIQKRVEGDSRIRNQLEFLTRQIFNGNKPR